MAQQTCVRPRHPSSQVIPIVHEGSVLGKLKLDCCVLCCYISRFYLYAHIEGVHQGWSGAVATARANDRWCMSGWQVCKYVNYAACDCVAVSFQVSHPSHLGCKLLRLLDFCCVCRSVCCHCLNAPYVRNQFLSGGAATFIEHEESPFRNVTKILPSQIARSSRFAMHLLCRSSADFSICGGSSGRQPRK